MYTMIWMGIKSVYAHGARKLLKEAINNEDSEIDETIMNALDRLFDYKQ